MIEKTFAKPGTRKIFEMQNVRCPKRINERFISEQIDNGILIQITDSYEESVKAIENLPEHSLALFSERFRISREESDYGIKSLEDLIKIDSAPVLREISGESYAPSRLTRKFAEQHRILPYALIRNAVGKADIENPPTGFYWIGLDNHVRATTWIRAVVGAEMQIMRQQGDFFGEVKDTKPYGRNLRVEVKSKTEENKKYEFTLFRLPMHYKGDIRQFSDWINISHNSSDADASYRGGEHEKRKFPVYIWSATSIFAFYEAMVFVSKNPEWRQFKINPFPIPTNKEMMNFIDKLRLRSLILRQEGERKYLTPLNKTEIDKIIGARTIARSYDSCWHHWGKRDLGYLYNPGD